MRYPLLLSFQEAFDKIEQFDTIIDTRSQLEFSEDHIFDAINCPVLNDKQRMQVGTLHKQVNAFEAKKLGAILIARNASFHIDKFFLDKPKEWKPLVYCWRGGKRSSAMVHIMSEIGWPVAQLQGGYLEYRRYVNDSLAELPNKFTFNVICGPTGSGKSRLLQALFQQGAQVLDLEEIATHRGSILGSIPEKLQPKQKFFESLIWQRLKSFDCQYPVFIESESRKIGNLQVPKVLIEKMRDSPCFSIRLALSCRIKLLMEDYVHFLDNDSLLSTQLEYLARYHGYQKVKYWQNLRLSGDIEELVKELLLVHYDPAYSQSISRNFRHFCKAKVVDIPDISGDTLLYIAKSLNENKEI